MTEIIKGECSVELIRENEDGSADYAFNFPPEAMQALTRLGILTAIKAGIEEAKRLNPEEPVKQEFTEEIKALAEEAGFVTWQGERWNIDNNVVDWANPYDDELVKFYYLARKQAIRDVISMFKEEHVLVKERHNYWLSAANMVKDEALEEDDDRQDQQ